MFHNLAYLGLLNVLLFKHDCTVKEQVYRLGLVRISKNKKQKQTNKKKTQNKQKQKQNCKYLLF